MDSVTFIVPGIATPWARAGRGGKFTFTPKPQRSFMGDIKTIASIAMKGRPLMTGPIEMITLITYPWPKSTPKKRQREPGGHWKDTRPDTSNLVKIIEDALNGITYLDDAQIAHSEISKRFGDKAEVWVSIKQLRPSIARSILRVSGIEQAA